MVPKRTPSPSIGINQSNRGSGRAALIVLAPRSYDHPLHTAACTLACSRPRGQTSPGHTGLDGWSDDIRFCRKVATKPLRLTWTYGRERAITPHLPLSTCQKRGYVDGASGS